MTHYSTVAEFLDTLDDTRRLQVQKLRKIILTTDSRLVEHIKWNNPSYVLNGEDRLTFNLSDTRQVRLVLHMGASRKEDKSASPIFEDNTGLLEWSSNIRAVVSFRSSDEIRLRQKDFTQILQKWLSLT